ncbi:MAG TPA: hypothetical protein DCZ40_02735 [Lachnospiraceae bacterium]|nr:hypothetical protein [Lachnospiraceae bacterium]
MNLKYYLRGLGLGIVMTAVIMGITAPDKERNLTDEEIVEKAKDLGMIEDSELAEYLEEAKAETEERVRNEIAAANAAMEMERLAKEENAGEGGETAVQEPEPGAQPKPEGEEEQEATQEGIMESRQSAAKEQDALPDNRDGEEETEKEEEVPEPVSFIVKKGETPYSIGQRLEEEGLLPEDANFDRFLVDNGYDTKVVAAEYEIPEGADMEMIALIITKQK